MTKLALALGSFLLGLSSIIAVNHVHAVAQIPQASREMLALLRPIVPELGVAVPRVSPLPPSMVPNSSNNLFVIGGQNPAPMVIDLDGLQSVSNVYASPAGVKIRYGGGAYKLERAFIGGPLEFEFTGAAANTVHLLQSVGLLPGQSSGQTTEIVRAPAPVEAPPNTPIVKRTTLNKPLRGDIASQYDGTKQ
jgi:hypothetical protein